MDKIAEQAANGNLSAAGVLVLLLLLVWLGNRAINGVDEKIKDNKDDVEKLREDTEAESKSIRDALKSLTDAFSANAIQTKEDMGKVLSEVSFIRGFLVGGSKNEEKELKNRRSTD